MLSRTAEIGQERSYILRARSTRLTSMSEYEYMRLDFTRLARATNLAAVGILVAIGAFLVTSPLHPHVGDSHRGLMAVFPGVLLLIFALLIHATGRWLNRRGYVASLVTILVSVVAIVIVAALQ